MKRLATSSVSAIALLLCWNSLAPGQEEVQTVPVRISVNDKSGFGADNLQIQAWIVVYQSKYQLDLRGESAVEFTDKLANLTTIEARADQYPAPPNVNLALMLRNVGSETFSFTEPGPQSPLDIVLGGTGAISYRQPPPDNAQAAPGLAPLLLGVRNTFIRPNETVRIPIRWLKCLPGGAPSYWTMPGEYTLRIRFTTGLDDIYGRIKWRGVAIESDPINLTVAAPPRSLATTIRRWRRAGAFGYGRGANGRGSSKLEGNCQSTATAARRRECPSTTNRIFRTSRPARCDPAVPRPVHRHPSGMDRSARICGRTATRLGSAVSTASSATIGGRTARWRAGPLRPAGHRTRDPGGDGAGIQPRPRLPGHTADAGGRAGRYSERRVPDSETRRSYYRAGQD